MSAGGVRLRRLSAQAALATIACGSPQVELVNTPSPAPVAHAPEFRAGFGKVDLTPPPGVGLSGNGSEGRRARGYRLRLYARALVLEDPAGSRLALVAVDMPHTSLLLQRRVAERLLAQGSGIGSDRLLLSATHTHSGPGHHYEARAFNSLNSEVQGYDPVLTDSLATRIARAVGMALDSLRPARLAWGTREVWGYTRVRSMQAWERNLPPPAPLGTPPPGLSESKSAVDPRLTLLRVDLEDSATGRYMPAGAYGIFAVHGTGNSSETELFDADVPGLVQRELERHVDSIRFGLGGAGRRAVHVFANGAVGDVSPDWPADSRCPPPLLRPRDGPGGPFGVRVWDWLRVAPAAASSCIASGRRAVAYVGMGIAAHAVALFDSLEPVPVDWSLQRAFRTVDFRTEGRALGVCREPHAGTATVGASPDSRTRMYRFRVLGIFDAGFEEGEPATDPDRQGCQADKRLLLGPMINDLYISKGLPRYGQFGVYRIGPMLIAGVPWEVTTESGQRIERAVREASPTAQTRVVSLANGYLYYLATAEEYTAQMYEGSSTLYGPGSAELAARLEAELAKKLSADSLPQPADVVLASPGAPKAVMDRPMGGTLGASLEMPICSGDTVIARFTRGRPGDWLPDGRPVIGFSPKARPDTTIAFDDHVDVEVWAIGRRGGVVRWEARWVPPVLGKWIVTLREESSKPAGPVTCGPPVSPEQP